MSLIVIKNALTKKFPIKIIDELLECYSLQKKNYFLGNFRPTEVEGGRFSEAAFRMLEHIAGFTMTPIGMQLDTDGLIRKLQSLSKNFSDSIRIHIPRTLRVVYDIRNKRDAAHLADGIDPNLQDSSFVFSCLDWVLAEFIWLADSTSPAEAYELVKAITLHSIPAIEEFGSFLKTLNPSLGVSERILLLLYNRGIRGATSAELSSWLKPSQRTNLTRALNTMNFDKDHIVLTNGKYILTRRGILEIQNKNLVHI